MIDSIINSDNCSAATLWTDLDTGKVYLYTTDNVNPPRKYELMENGDFKFIEFFTPNVPDVNIEDLL